MAISQQLLNDIRECRITEEELSLSHSEIDDEDVVLLSEALKLNHNIKKLDLHENNISDRGLVALSDITHLESLDLSANNISEKGIREFSEKIAALSDITHLESLDLSVNAVGDEIAVLSNLKNLKLKRLYASQCGITDKGASELFSSKSIEELHLDINDIAGSAFEQLRTNNVLQQLNLIQNPLVSGNFQLLTQDSGACSLSLYLGCNFIGDKIAVILSGSSLIRELHMIACHVQDSGAKALSENQNIKVLSLGFNDITDVGVSCFHKNYHLLSLDLVNNPCDLDKFQAKQLFAERHRGQFTRTEEFIACLKKEDPEDVKVSNVKREVVSSSVNPALIFRDAGSSSDSHRDSPTLTDSPPQKPQGLAQTSSPVKSQRKNS